MPLSEDAAQLAREKLAVLTQADAFAHMLTLPGWQAIYALHVEWVETYRTALAKVNTAEPAVALEALRQWQLAEEFLKVEATYINTVLQQAEDLRGTKTLADALLMEQYQHEQSESAGDSAGSNRSGY